MWRWIGLACLVYGLSSLWLLFGQRPAVPDGPPFAPGGPPPGSAPPAAVDFEGQFPPPITRPRTEVHVIELAGGNHALEWRLPPRGVRVFSLAQPLRPQPGATQLVLDIGADQQREVRIGLREADGSVYLASRRIGGMLLEERVSIAELRPAEQTEDENGQLDAEQVTAVVVIVPELRQQGGRRGPAVFTLDNLRFE